MTADPDDEVVGRVADGVLRITFNRPDRLNAFSARGYRQFAALLQSGADDPHVVVVVVHGAGRAFSSGVDLGALADLGDPHQVATLRDGFAVLLGLLTTFPKPVIAAVHGYAIGFGMTMLLHFDLVLVAADARLRMPFVELGVAPEAASSVMLPARVGWQHATWLLMSGAWVDADEAVELGLAWRKCDDDVLEAALAVARQLAGGSTAALQAAKRLLVAGRQESVFAALDREQRTIL